MYTVACMKWGDKYGPEYVNRLYNMVERNTTLPFKFICFTDNADGLLPEAMYAQHFFILGQRFVPARSYRYAGPELHAIRD